MDDKENEHKLVCEWLGIEKNPGWEPWNDETATFKMWNEIIGHMNEKERFYFESYIQGFSSPKIFWGVLVAVIEVLNKYEAMK